MVKDKNSCFHKHSSELANLPYSGGGNDYERSGSEVITPTLACLFHKM
jgi:hypothetical protein